MSERRVAVVTAGLSTPSSTRMLADRLATATVAGLADRGIDASVDIVEVRTHAHQITDNLLTGFAPPALEAAINQIVSADAVIAVTPVFSSSYSGLFKSFIDVLEPGALTGKPVLLAATGGSARHSLALEYAMRPLFAYLRAEPVPTSVFAAPEDWAGSGEGASSLRSRIDRAAGELVTAIAGRTRESVTDPFDPAAYLGEGRSFGSLLGRVAPSETTH